MKRILYHLGHLQIPELFYCKIAARADVCFPLKRRSLQSLGSLHFCTGAVSDQMVGQTASLLSFLLECPALLDG